MQAAPLILSAASSVAAGVSASQQAQSQKQQAEANAYIGKTRAIQTDTEARTGLSGDLGSLRATFAALGQKPGVGTFEIMQEFRKSRNRDRRIEFGNRMQESYSYSAAADAYGRAGTASLLGGFLRAGPSLFDLYQMRKP